MVHGSLFLLVACTSQTACSPSSSSSQFYRLVLWHIEKGFLLVTVEAFLPLPSLTSVLSVGHVQQHALYQKWDGKADSLGLVECSCSSCDLSWSLFSGVTHWWIILSKGLLHGWGDLVESKKSSVLKQSNVFVLKRTFLFLVWFLG